jgi:4-aminobutyrate aminotransferase-like enzyme/Ser/Thr protein kinase RdoA (MazF antagonist)
MYNNILISSKEAESIVFDIYGIKGKASALNGEIDFNFKIETDAESYILKVSRPDFDEKYLDFQDKLLLHLEGKDKADFPRTYRTDQKGIFEYKDKSDRIRKIRLLHWMDGNLMSSLSFKSNHVRHTLGLCGGDITTSLIDFDHSLSKREFDWDLASALWVEDYLHLFKDEEFSIIQYFIALFKKQAPIYNALRKSTIHNDANDNNVLVNATFNDQKTIAIIDYGDAVYSQVINDLAVILAYSIMDCPQPLQAAIPTVTGYHEAFKLLDEELQMLYTLVAMRLVISVTKSAINKSKEPDNAYLQISEKSAWQLLRQWKNIAPNFAYFSFRHACGFVPCPNQKKFEVYTIDKKVELSDLLPTIGNKKLSGLDLSIESKFIGNFSNYIASENLYGKIKTLYEQEHAVLAGGYGEARPIYTTDAYKVNQNEGYEHRTIHMGVDLWTDACTPIAAIEHGEIFSCYNNDHHKDYGPTIIIKHEINDLTFYTLYGHLTKESLLKWKKGDTVPKGQIIGAIGNEKENGHWAPHLHFQIMLDMLDCSHDFYGVSLPSLWPIFASICPDPNLLFKNELLTNSTDKKIEDLISSRKKNLGKSLSLSYSQPLHIVRGQMQYLIDIDGQKYLDTVNNVAHVGHENPKIVDSAVHQLNLLNTNTRYLNEEILAFAQSLLSTLPKELCVVHFMNSGSEANELALRMARAYTHQKDIIALEVGYHGNTQACIDISSYKFDGKGGNGCPDHTHIVPLPDAFRGKYRGETAGPSYANHVKETIEELKKNGKNVSAFIAESIVSCGGQIDLPKDYLKLAYEYVRAEGGLCISDEVQVGFGRVGKSYWGFQLHDVIPDIVTMGKPIGNGHPLGAVVCTRAVAEAFANGMEYFNTFGGNPVSCAIGNAVLKNIKDENLQDHAFAVGNYLKNGLKTLSIKHPIIKDVRGEGLFLGVEFNDDDLNPLPLETDYIINKMKDYKILTSSDGPDHNVLKIKPPMCFTEENAAYFIECLDKILESIQ